MKKILSLFLAVGLFSSTAFAQVTSSDLMGLGMPAELATKVASISSGSGLVPSSDIIPATDNSVDLGSASVEFADAFFDGTVTTDAINNSGTSTLTGVVTFGNGSAAAPSFGFASSSNTGIYRSGSSEMSVSNAGAQTWIFGSTGTFRSTATSDIGWSVQAAANQACNTTCTAGCVFGADTATDFDAVACTDATADICLCAGAS